MLDFLQYLVLGLLVGGIYALAASGLTLVFGVMRIINIAHGAFLILGAFLAFTVWSKLGIDPMLAIRRQPMRHGCAHISAPELQAYHLLFYLTIATISRSFESGRRHMPADVTALTGGYRTQARMVMSGARARA